MHTNDAGLTGLYFPFLQIFGGLEPDLFETLKNHVLKEEFVYHHDWEDGDVVISEQWLSIHKRWAFDKMDQRVLHRIGFDYSNARKFIDKNFVADTTREKQLVKHFGFEKLEPNVKTSM